MLIRKVIETLLGRSDGKSSWGIDNGGAWNYEEWNCSRQTVASVLLLILLLGDGLGKSNNNWSDISILYKSIVVSFVMIRQWFL